MTIGEFEEITGEEYDKVPQMWRKQLDNVVLLVEENSPEGDLLGLYEGVPLIERGAAGALLPDRITLFFAPCVAEARELWLEQNKARPFAHFVRHVVRETIWHEIAHHLGMDEEQVDERERGGTNRFG